MLRCIKTDYRGWAMEHWPDYDGDPLNIASTMHDCLWAIAETEGLQPQMYRDGGEYLDHVVEVYKSTGFATSFGESATVIYAPLGRGIAVLDVTSYPLLDDDPSSVPF